MHLVMHLGEQAHAHSHALVHACVRTPVFTPFNRNIDILGLVCGDLPDCYGNYFRSLAKGVRGSVVIVRDMVLGTPTS